jgi:hypothetical protein
MARNLDHIKRMMHELIAPLAPEEVAEVHDDVFTDGAKEQPTPEQSAEWARRGADIDNPNVRWYSHEEVMSVFSLEAQAYAKMKAAERAAK